MDIWVRRGIMRAGIAMGATLTAAAVARKPVAQTILTPKPEHAVRLEGMEAMVPTTPPAPPAPPAAQSFIDAEGKPATLTDFAGKGVVLNLWATWCVPCVAELPSLDALSQRLAAEGIIVVPLSSDRGGAPVVQKFYAAHSIAHLGVWLDPRGVAARSWGARGLPTTLIIDRKGQERGRLEGGADWASDAALAQIRKMVG